ncbi:MAG: type II secretion system F family protein [Fimbriimonadaceae bacterium]|nr:type II secretion system F family protein [Fimbriimonadaceae bacterium]
MPQYRYEGTDRNGQPTEGVISASSTEQATYLLSERGYRIATLALTSRLTTPTTPPISPATAAPPGQAIKKPIPAAALTQATFKTKPAGDKERFFLFGQLAEQVRSGISPADALLNLSTYQVHSDLKHALGVMSKATSEGGAISDVMALYPDLFPEGSVGMVRAGEQGGFLPDALQEVADQAGRAHKFRRWFWFTWFIGINALISIPLVFLATRAMLATWEKMDTTQGGTATDVGVAMRQSYIEKIIWPWGPLFVLAVGGTFYLRYLLSSTKMAAFRHKLGMKWPVFGKRAQHECVTTFTWVLGKLARSGIAPNRAWALASRAVPNLEMRDRLLMAGQAMGDGSKLSQAAIQSGVLQHDYVSMLQTGELTGDVPGALQRVAEMSYAEYEAQQNYAKMRGGCWGVLGCFVTSGICLIVFYYFWYHELLGSVLKGLDP